jgi:hypothetical protein
LGNLVELPIASSLDTIWVDPVGMANLAQAVDYALNVAWVFKCEARNAGHATA